jgi:hypothetical protein
MAEYRAEKNTRSLDGLAGLPQPGEAPEAQLATGAPSPTGDGVGR